jgi:hypothetical protein
VSNATITPTDSASSNAASAATSAVQQARLWTNTAALFIRFDWLVLPLLAFSLSRGMIFLVGIIGDTYFPTDPGHWIADPNNTFLSLWAKWDSQWYVQIARLGYFIQVNQQSNVAFFPLYPLLMRVVARVLDVDVVFAGFLVSNACFLVALTFLYRLTALEFNDRASAQRAIFYMAFYPTAFFFSAVYTESLFLMLTVVTMYFARTQRWLPAAACGMLATATRNIGVVIWGLVMWEWLRVNGWRITAIHHGESWRRLWAGVRQHWDQVLIIAIIPLGLLLYMGFLDLSFDSPLAFIEVQSAWNRENIGPIAVLLRDIPRLFDIEIKRWYFTHFFNTISTLFVLGMAPFVWRKLGEGYALYVLILILVPIASSLGSVARYVLPMFPIFMLLGWWGRKATFNHTVLAVFAMLLALATTIFVNWIFVA